MPTPGYLCVGAAESLLRITDRFELEEVGGAFVYVKTTATEKGRQPMTDIVRVVVVDDSAYVRKVVKQMLSRSPFIEVVGTARDGAEALEMVAELKPDVVTCDLNMPAMDGVAFVRAADGAPAGADPHHQHRERSPASRCSRRSMPAPSTSSRSRRRSRPIGCSRSPTS